MLKARWLILAFCVAFLFFVISMAPARLLIDRVPVISLPGGQLALSQPSGTVWRGAADWRWRHLQGQMAWTLGFGSLSPALDITLTGGLGFDGQLSGWSVQSLAVTIDDAEVPASLIEHVSPFKAAGLVKADAIALRMEEGLLVSAQGELNYSGGEASWPQGSKALPPLQAQLKTLEDGVQAQVFDDTKVLMMQASLQGNNGRVQVYRAWPMLLGVSKGGNPEDVVFETSSPVFQQ